MNTNVVWCQLVLLLVMVTFRGSHTGSHDISRTRYIPRGVHIIWVIKSCNTYYFPITIYVIRHRTCFFSINVLCQLSTKPKFFIFYSKKYRYCIQREQKTKHRTFYYIIIQCLRLSAVIVWGTLCIMSKRHYVRMLYAICSMLEMN